MPPEKPDPDISPEQNPWLKKLAIWTAIITAIGALVAAGTSTLTSTEEAWKKIFGTTHEPALDQALLANGNTQPGYSCATTVQCQVGAVCADNGGDGKFYCRPMCLSDADCTRSRCVKHFLPDGTLFPHLVCNVSSPSYLAPVRH